MFANMLARIPANIQTIARLFALLLLTAFNGQLMAQSPNQPLTQHCLGQGAPLYLIGGGPAFTTWNLKPVQTFLASDYRVCRWDMRGIGDNVAVPFEPGTTVIDHWLQDMAAQLPDEPVILWGQSWGALQVLLFARQYPDRVDSIVLSNPVDPALRSLEGIESRRYIHPRYRPELDLDDIGTPVESLYNLHMKIASYFVDGRKGWDYAAGFTLDDASKELNVRIWEEYRNSPITDRDMQGLANKISGLLYCRQDVLQPANQLEYKRLVADTRHIVLQNCAHFPWEESPRDYYRALALLLGKS